MEAGNTGSVEGVNAESHWVQAPAEGAQPETAAAPGAPASEVAAAAVASDSPADAASPREIATKTLIGIAQHGGDDGPRVRACELLLLQAAGSLGGPASQLLR